ncbi:cobyrinate a,c-diamide synthase, partial [bacterium]|nr:cobyrinate a,c-diamide synthase [bacterium]
YAECGGLLYLSDSIENSEMAGIFSGKCQLTKSLQRFGYVDVKLKQDCLLGKKGETFTAHEFHKSTADIKGETLYTVSKTMGEDTWNCGYSYKNAVAGYPHVNFLGNIDIFRNILRFVEKNRLLNTIC